LISQACRQGFVGGEGMSGDELEIRRVKVKREGVYAPLTSTGFVTSHHH